MAYRILLSFLLAGAVTILAEKKTDFSGKWRIDLDQSDFGARPAPPAGLAIEMRHSDPELVLTQVLGEVRDEFRLTTDGTECSNTMRGEEMKSRVNWDKQDLIVDSKLGSLTMKDRMMLSEDGKTLTVKRHMASDGGEQDLKLVFRKE